MMKTLIPLFLMVASLVAVAQTPSEPSTHLPHQPFAEGLENLPQLIDGHRAQDREIPLIPAIEVERIRVEELMDLVKGQLKQIGQPVPNFVYKGGAEKQVIPSLQIRKVSLKGLLHALEAIAELKVDILENPGGEEIIVLKRPAPAGFGGGREAIIGRVGTGEFDPFASKPAEFPRSDPFGGFENGSGASPQMTRVFAVSDLGVKQGDLMTTIHAVWDISDPDWAKGERAAKLIYHPGTRILVVKASPERLADVEQVIQQLKQVKERADKAAVTEVRKRMEEVARSGERAVRDAERARDRAIDEMSQERAKMIERIAELEERLRESELQRAMIREEEKAREGRR